MTTLASAQISGRSLVAEELFQRLADRVAKEEGWSPQLAARVTDQALAFLGTCAVNRGPALSPSRMVDAGWHAFLLHSQDYRTFCGQVAGKFIDHVPSRESSVRASEPASPLHRTVMAMRAAGYRVDDELWFQAGHADCTGCANGCHDDPPPVGQGR